MMSEEQFLHQNWIACFQGSRDFVERPPRLGLIETNAQYQCSYHESSLISSNQGEKNSSIQIHVEGSIYSHDLIELERVIAAAFAANDTAATWKIISSYQQQTDGEFVIAAENRVTGKRLLFNDQYGRLPLYWATKNRTGELVIGRSASAVARASNRQSPDRLGVAARLLFGYPMDNRTEYAEVTSVPEATTVILPSYEAPPDCFYGSVNYGLGSSGRDVKRGDPYVAKLGEALITACHRRASRMQEHMPTLALSGGLDSRLIACAMHAAGLEFEAITRSDYLGEPRDLIIARQAANLLLVNHHEVQAGPIGTSLLLDLIRTTEGTLEASLAHMLGFLINVKRIYGSKRFLLTGDGGDKTVAPLLPPGPISEHVEAYRLLSSASRKDRQAVLSLLGVSAREFSDYCHEAFASQPGVSAAEKARALVFRQRSRRWLGVAEDRNRSVFWSTSPFYSPEFMELTSQIRDSSKQRDQLYLALLDWFNPSLSRLPRPGRGRHRMTDRLMIEMYLQLSRSPLLTNLYRSLKFNFRQSSEPDNTLIGLLACAQKIGGGIWDICDPEQLLQSITNLSARPWVQRLTSLALRDFAISSD